jgi:hypothetical protein
MKYTQFLQLHFECLYVSSNLFECQNPEQLEVQIRVHHNVYREKGENESRRKDSSAIPSQQFSWCYKKCKDGDRPESLAK